MARPTKQEQEESTFHELDKQVSILAQKMEAIERHHNYYKSNFDQLFIFMQDFKVSLVKIDNTLNKHDDLPEKVRKLEDKAIVIELLKSLGWVVVGALIAGFVSQSFVATNERRDYNVTRNR